MSFFRDLGGFNAALAKVAAAKREGRNAGLFAAGEHILGVSNESVPHEEGDFERSGGVSQDERFGTTAISYSDTAYPGQAANLHEDMGMMHDEGRHAKFLEQAMASERDVALALAAQALKDRLK